MHHDCRPVGAWLEHPQPTKGSRPWLLTSAASRLGGLPDRGCFALTGLCFRVPDCNHRALPCADMFDAFGVEDKFQPQGVALG